MTIQPEMLENDFLKFHKSRPWFPDEDKLDMAFEALDRMFSPYIRDSRFKEFEAALHEAEGSASCGYLFKKLGFTTKKQVFENFQPQLKEMISDICLGKIVDTLWEASPKVEIRALEKIISEDLTKRKQRTFMCCDVLCYIIGIMLYGDQNDKFLSAQSGTWSAVGSSIFYGGWHALLSKLGRIANKFRCFDIKAMEASISPELFRRLYAFRNKYLKVPKRFKPLLDWFLENKIYSKVVDLLGRLGYKIGCNPSGCLNTLMDNTLICIVILLYHLAKKCNSIQELMDKVDENEAESMGDDSILADKEDWDGLESSSLEIGFEMTPEIKGAVSPTEAKFLNFSWKFNVVHNMWVFVPNYDKLFAGLYFYRKNNSWRLTLAKLCAMKVLCYTDEYYYKIVCFYIDFIWKHHMQDLKNEINLDDKISYNSLRAMELDDKQIEFLIYGLENEVKIPEKKMSYFQQGMILINELY
jgi:hypothetical protein